MIYSTDHGTCTWFVFTIILLISTKAQVYRFSRGSHERPWRLQLLAAKEGMLAITAARCQPGT